MSTIVEVKNLKKYFYVNSGTLHAVDGVTFKIEEGETFGVVGESGCGKSTLGKTIVKLLPSTSGNIYFNGKDVTNIDKKELFKLRKNMQIIFQDPFSSLDPRFTVLDCISEPMINIGMQKKEIKEKVEQLMDLVGLAKRWKNAYPHELDGGRRQRIGIARALAINPKFIVCDEPVSALDVSIQAQTINLLLDLQEKLGLTYIFITHDLSVVRYISDTILVMYLGQMVEKCEAEELFRRPLHPYTKALLSAVPVADIDCKSNRIILKGELVSPINPKPGCRFAARCIYAKEKCFQINPELRDLGGNHIVSCHYVEAINKIN